MEYAERARIGRWIVALTVPAAVVSLGSLFTHTLTPVLMAAAVGLSLLYVGAPEQAPRPSATVLFWVAMALTGYTVLQLVPLPASWLASLSPANAEVWKDALRPLKEPGPSLTPLSLDPAATAVEVARGLVYVCVYLAGLQIARRTEGTLFLERVLVASTLTLAVVSLLHPALGLERVLGLYQPTSPHGPRHTAPLLNANHLGGYVNVGICILTGILVAARPAIPKAIAAVFAVLLVGVQVFIASRGALGSMVVGIVAVVGLSRATGPKVSTAGRNAALAVLGLVAFGAMMGLAADERAWTEVLSKDLSKLDIFRHAVKLLQHHGVFGIGRGAFESVFPRERAGIGNIVFTHPENVLLQWTTEWGLPVSAVAIGAIAWALRPRSAFTRSHMPLGAWGALAALALQNLVDFSSEVPGVMVALALCAAMVTAGVGSSPHKGSGWAKRPTPLGAGLAVASLAVAAWVFAARDGELFAEQHRLKERVTTPAGTDPMKYLAADREAFHVAIRAAMLRHPAEPYFPFLGAYRAATAQDENPIPWVARALDRSPTYGRAHLILARSLFRISPSQARLEYRLAFEQDHATFEAFRDEAYFLVGSHDDALELLPGPETPAADRVWLMELLVTHLDDRLPATRVRIDEAQLALDPKALPPLERAARDALHDLEESEPWCQPAKACADEALKRAEAFRAASPGTCTAHVLVAQATYAVGNPTHALAELESAIDGVVEHGDCLRALAELSMRAGDRARAAQALDHLAELPCAKTEECVANLAFAATLEEKRKNPRRALAHYRKAAGLASDRSDILAEQARLAKLLDLHSEASDVYGKLAEKEPENPQWAALRDEELKAAHSRTLKLDVPP
jgi:hypothetical protein